MTAHYWNEHDEYPAQWLRNIIAAGYLPPGEVDTRSIADVQPDDLRGFTQCHFFAGIGGWSLAARLAGWPDDRELWTGSCPCQPFSAAGKGLGHDDERHLWPHQLRLLSARRPAVWMGEQVAAAVGKDWLDGVLADVEAIGYAGRAVVVPACAVDAPHRRDRLWIVAEPQRDRCERREPHCGLGISAGAAVSSGEANHVANDPGDGREQGVDATASARHGRVAASASRASGSGELAYANGQAWRSEARQPITSGGNLPTAIGEIESRRRGGSAWSGAVWIVGHDGKARRVEPSIRLLVHGVPARVGRLRAYGNAIVPQVAAEVISAYMECRP